MLSTEIIGSFSTNKTTDVTNSADTDDRCYKCLDEQRDALQKAKNYGNSHTCEDPCLCDISLMQIRDDSKIPSCSNSSVSSMSPPMRVDDEADCNGNVYMDVADISRSQEEQTITELVRVSRGGELTEAGNSTMQVAFGIILRLVLPLANGVARGIKGIRDVRFLRVLRNIASSHQAFTNLVAYAANTLSMNLSAVQVSYRIDPILKLMKIRKLDDEFESLPDSPTPLGSTPGCSRASTPCSSATPTIQSPFFREPRNSLPYFPTSKQKSTPPEEEAGKCCTLNILAEPPPGVPIRADIIFIHGLHGSLANTWKQGLWENDRQPVNFERPPKPPVRPPKRPRHSRSILLRPPHKQKRARFAHSEWSKQSCDKDTEDELGSTENKDFSYICGEPENIQICDGVEYSFPTFRVRMNDNGRLLHSELASISDAGNPESSRQSKKNDNRDKSKNTPKPSSSDPDYASCWPGDWLPLDCPGVRVIALNYTTDQYLWRPLWKPKETRTNLIQRSREMAELLVRERVGYGHPIVWVGHSKGGLFVKQIIVDAWESGRLATAPFWRSARGAFFYSVPHRGSHLASIKAPLLTRSVELIDIEKNSKYLLDLHQRFAGLYHLGHLKIEVFSFVETALTLMSVLYLRIVGVDSADPGIGDVCGIRLDHREICKPRSRECILYTELVKMIRKVY